MTNYREILRMHSLGFNKTEISQSLTCSRTTVRTVIHLAESLGLSYPLPKDMSDKALYEALFPSAAGRQKYKMPDYGVKDTPAQSQSERAARFRV